MRYFVMGAITLFFSVIALSGCQEQPTPYKGTANGTYYQVKRTDGWAGDRYMTFCIEGVTYYKLDRGITIALDKDSKIVPCSE